MLTVIIIIWMLVFMALGLVNLIYGRGRKWTFTWSHLLWFVVGMVFIAIPFGCVLQTISK